MVEARKAVTLAGIASVLDSARETSNEVSDIAPELLPDTGNNPSLQTIRRITTTIEAVSAYASFPDNLHPGRLTEDIDPPGFDSFAFGSSAVVPHKPSARAAPAKVSAKPKTGSSKKADREEESRRERQERIAAAKVALQETKKTFNEARAKTKSLEASQKKADSARKEAEKQKLEAEERLRKASIALNDAARRARTVTAEFEEATAVLKRAQRDADEASRELEKAFRE